MDELVDSELVRCKRFLCSRRVRDTNAEKEYYKKHGKEKHLYRRIQQNQSENRSRETLSFADQCSPDYWLKELLFEIDQKLNSMY
jgi:hypothetical protein